MKLKELRKLIDNIPKEMDECEVICQKDSEGNGYSPLAGVDENGIYQPDTTWSGDVFDSRWTANEVGMEEEEWEKLKNKNKAIILSPTN